MAKHESARESAVNQRLYGCVAGLPVGPLLAPRVAVHREEDAFFQQACEVFDVGGVGAVADTDAIQVDSFLLKDLNLSRADAFRRPLMSADGDSGRLAGPGRTPQRGFTLRCDALHVT